MFFIDFWGISRFNILGGLRFKVTLYQNRYFWLKSPIFRCPVNLKAIFKKNRQNTKLAIYPYFFMRPCILVHQNLIFVWPRWCRQVSLFADRNLGHFPFWGAHLQKGLKSSLSGRKQSTEQLNGHFPEKQRHSKICQDTGVICSHRICDFRDQKMG